MANISDLESNYKNYINNMYKLIPESVISVDMDLLQHLNLLNYHQPGKYEPNLTTYFQLIESPEKITLVNSDFVVWISPRKDADTVSTYTLIALNRHDHPQLEMAFIASGVYNTSALVLRILEKLLLEIQENEELIQKLSK